MGSPMGGWFKTSYESSHISCVLSVSQIFGVVCTWIYRQYPIFLFFPLCAWHIYSLLCLKLPRLKGSWSTSLYYTHRVTSARISQASCSVIRFHLPALVACFLYFLEQNWIKEHSKGTLQSLPLLVVDMLPQICSLLRPLKNLPQLTEGSRVLKVELSNMRLSGTKPWMASTFLRLSSTERWEL